MCLNGRMDTRISRKSMRRLYDMSVSTYRRMTTILNGNGKYVCQNILLLVLLILLSSPRDTLNRVSLHEFLSIILKMYLTGMVKL